MQLVQLIYDFYQPDQRYFPDLTKRLTKKQINLQYRKQFTCWELICLYKIDSERLHNISNLQYNWSELTSKMNALE